MQGLGGPNRLGLGLRNPLPSYGQGPSMAALAQQHQQSSFSQAPHKRAVTLFVGSISGGITDDFLSKLLAACGPITSFKRLITPANKPQGFGFAEFEDADGALRAITLLNNVELPALEDGCVNKKLLVKADEKTKTYLDAYVTSKRVTDADTQIQLRAKEDVSHLVTSIFKQSDEAATDGKLDRERYVIPPHLHDLHEADLPETQRGLVISEIAQFRERAAKKERERQRALPATINALGPGQGQGMGMGMGQTPSGPGGPNGMRREWGKPAEGGGGRAFGSDGQQGYGKPVGFVKEAGAPAGRTKTDEEAEAERKEARRREEEDSFRDRERRYEPRERSRIQALERAIQRERQTREAEARDGAELRSHLHVWDDDASDELFYTDRLRWRQQRIRRLTAEEQSDRESRAFEDREAEHLRRESEAFLSRQMDEVRALADEQRKAGMLLDDGAPVKLSVSISLAAPDKNKDNAGGGTAAPLFGAEEDEEEERKKRKAPMQLLDFTASNDSAKAKERLGWIAESVPREREVLFKAKVRWDAVTDTLVDRKFEPLVKRLMVKYLGELEDDDLVLFVLEHLKDHKSPRALVEGLEPVLEEEAAELAIAVWRQVIFESMAYGEGLHTERMLVDDSV
ncbi:hypothetical protein PENSPDRAFT_653670 [Peniophora sp. CONT]|nr:hypothetical protein PENSPDRAFT_653670 [Peniophora sp. CONT]